MGTGAYRAFIGAVLAVLLTSLASMATSTPALAAADTISGMSKAQIQKRRAVLLQDMLREPQNLKLAFEYVKLSEAVGDYEGAASTLERILIYAPNTPEVELDLGLAYYQLGAYGVSRGYLQQTLANPATSAGTDRQAKLYLQQIGMAEPPHFAGTLFSGIEWESNANSGPANRNVNVGGIDFTLDPQSTGKPDWSVLNIGTLHFAHDLKNTQGDQLTFDFLGYSDEHFQQHDVDLNFLEAAAGPSFNMRRFGMNGTRLYVYALGDIAFLGSDFYLGAPGAGIQLLSYAAPRSALDIRLETRERQFNNSHTYPDNTQWNGLQSRYNLTYSYFLAPGLVLTVQGQAQRENSAARYYANWQVSGAGALSWTFANPIRTGGNPWTWQIGGGGLHRQFDQPDTAISQQTEADRVFWARSSMIIPVSDSLALVPSVEYLNQNSNYSISRYDDLSALIGLQKTF